MTNENSNQEEYSLITKVDERVSTDVATDLKNGIYNLFISLLNQYTIEFGPEKAISLSTQYLDEISINFKNVINSNN